MKRFAFIMLAILAMGSSCASFEANRWTSREIEPDPKYKELAAEEGKPEALVYCYAVKSPSKKPEKLTLADLSERGQQAYVQAMASKAKTSADMREELGSPIVQAKKEEGKEPDIANTEFKRTLVISVSKGLNARLGDRLTWARVDITPVDESFAFTGYTIAATETETIDIANVKHTKGFSLGAKLSPTLSGSVIGAGEVGADLKSEREITSKIEQTYTKLDVGIQPGLLRVIREGERNRDVNGNTIIKLTLRVKSPDDTHKGFNVLVVRNQELEKEGVLLKPAKATASFKLVRFPSPAALKASVRLVYELRKIQSGDVTYVEGDDEVKIERGVSKSEQVLVPGNEVVRPLWGLKVKSKITAKDGMPILAQTALIGPLDVVFTDYMNAKFFAIWLSKYSVKKIGKASLYAGVRDRYLAAGDKVVVRRIN